MPRLEPITAVRYAAETNDISELIAPPYDVLDEGPKQKLLARNPANIVAVDLPVTPPKTLGPDAAYEQAGQLYRQWLDDGVLARDAQPAIYVYEQQFDVDGKTLKRRGIFANLAVEEFGRAGGGIHRHEKTIKGGTDDRLKLMQATKAQLSPIFAMYADPEAKVIGTLREAFENAEPTQAGVTDSDGVIHRTWAVTDERIIDQLRQFFDPCDVFIADGHHRYTTALNYAREHPDQPQAQNCLFMLVAMEDAGMIVLPTHRVLTGVTDLTTDALEAAIKAEPKLALTPTDHGREGLAALAASLPGAGEHAMGVYDPESDRTWLVTTTSPDPLADLTPDRPEVWRKLDVAVMHELLIDRVLRPKFGGDAIAYKYTAYLGDMVDLAHAEPGRLALLIQPTPQQSVCEVSRAGDVMPPKSTFFYPKLATGLVINPLD